MYTEAETQQGLADIEKNKADRMAAQSRKLEEQVDFMYIHLYVYECICVYLYLYIYYIYFYMYITYIFICTLHICIYTHIYKYV
jgi:hypothetical protein